MPKINKEFINGIPAKEFYSQRGRKAGRVKSEKKRIAVTKNIKLGRQVLMQKNGDLFGRVDQRRLMEIQKAAGIDARQQQWDRLSGFREAVDNFQ